jgi:hypothetical protein
MMSFICYRLSNHESQITAFLIHKSQFEDSLAPRYPPRATEFKLHADVLP